MYPLTPTENFFDYSIPSLQDQPYINSISCQIFEGLTFTHSYPQADYFPSNPVEHYRGSWTVPQSTKTTQFLKEGTQLEPVTTITNYEYNDNFLIAKEEIDTRRTRTENSGSVTYVEDNPNGEFVEVETTYPDDNAYNGQSSLIAVPLTSPVSKKVYNTAADNVRKYILGQYFEYYGGSIKAIYKYNKGEGVQSGAPSYVPSNYERTASFLHQGKPTQVQKEDGIYTAYIWDSTKTYLLAEVVNATYSSASSYLTQTLDMATRTEGEILTQINNIRQGIPNAQVTTYIYDPLVGITKVVDPKGYAFTYHYDGLGRLKFVKDADDYLVSKNEYNYKN